MRLFLSIYEILIPGGFGKGTCFSLEMFVLQMEMCLRTKGQPESTIRSMFSEADFAI